MHDLLIEEDQWNAPLVERQGRFLALKDDVATAKGAKEDPRKAYDFNEHFLRTFIKACTFPQGKSTNVVPSINPYPLLHQLKRGNFIVKAQNQPESVWIKIIERLAM